MNCVGQTGKCSLCQYSVDERRAITAILEEIRRDYYLSPLGPRGVNYGEFGGGGHVFDAAASHRLHMSFRTVRHRAMMARWERIRYALERLDPRHARYLELALDPSAPGYGGDQLVRFALGLPETNISVVALVPETRTVARMAVRAQQLAPEGGDWQSRTGYATIMAAKVRQGDRKVIKSVREECWRLLRDAARSAKEYLAEYDARERELRNTRLQRYGAVMAPCQM